MEKSKACCSHILLFLLFVTSSLGLTLPITNHRNPISSKRHLLINKSWSRHHRSFPNLHATNSDEDNVKPDTSISYYENSRWYKPLKTSLIQYGTEASAQPWIINLIEWAHLALFPLSFWLAWTIYSNQDFIIATLDGSNVSVFWILLSHLCQTFAPGVAGILYHEYEDWQFAEFQDPPIISTGFNNSRLRKVFLGVLIGLLTLSSFLMIVGIYGNENPTLIQGLVVLSLLVKCFAPKTPDAMAVLTPLLGKLGISDSWNTITKNRPVLPISIWDFSLFMIHTIIACAAYATLFSLAIQNQWPFLPSTVCALLSIVPFTTVALGGLYEGLIAETSFNQWDHLIGVTFFAIGISLQAFEFEILR